MKIAILDTNSVVHSLVSESLALTKANEDYDRLILSIVVLVEITFVLERVFKLPRIEIVRQLRQIIINPKIESDRALYFEISEIYQNQPKLSIVDCFILVQARDQDIDIVSSDKKLLKKYESWK